MRQSVTIRNSVDDEGHPAGGSVRGEGLEIRWQDGIVSPSGYTNGAFVEDVLEACQRRIEFYQTGRFACEENMKAIQYIAFARDVLAERIARRTEAGIQNSYEGN